MEMLNKMNKILYQHIPKTGGQTLAVRIASAFPADRSSFMEFDLNYPNGVDILKSLLEKKDFIECHVNGPVLMDFKELDVLTTIREPVSQLVSNYFHILRDPKLHLHTTAKLLSPEEFFSRYGDLLANHQTRYFISAYSHLSPDLDRLTAWASIMLESIKRVRWFVPTENIDEFCMLWQIETGMQMQLAESDNINVAGSSYGDIAEIKKIVKEMPELYSIDLLLWQTARLHYGNYRRFILNKAIADPYPDNWGRVWSEEGYGIWLGKSWYQPQTTSDGLLFWAGPERLSEVRFKRNKNKNYLVFSVSVFCGVNESSIYILCESGKVLHPHFLRISDHEVVFVVDLKLIGEEGLFWIGVPEVWSSVMQSNQGDDTSRRSIATTKWQLCGDSPF